MVPFFHVWPGGVFAPSGAPGTDPLFFQRSSLRRTILKLRRNILKLHRNT
jgi:hypothetical protein